MLVPGVLAKEMKAFVTKANGMTQEDADKAIEAYCSALEKAVYNAIRNLTLTIPSGMVIVATPTGPAANPAPIVLTKMIS